MPVTRQQWLKSRKLYNPDDALVSHDVNAADSSLAESVLKNVVVSNSNVKNLSQNAEKVLETVGFQQSGYCGTSSSPEHAAVQTVVEALIEPLSEDKGGHSKYLQKANKAKKVANKNGGKEGTETDVDAIEIIKSTDSRFCEKSQTEEISLPRTLTELNKNVDLNKTEITTSNGSQNRPNVIKQIAITKSVKKIENKSAFDSQISSGKENINAYLVNNNKQIPPKKKVVRKKVRAYAQSKPESKAKRKKIQRKILGSSSTDELHTSATGEKVNDRLDNITKRTTGRIRTHDDFNSVLSFTQKTATASSSPNTITAKNRRISFKTHSFSKRISNKSFSKNYHPGCVLRQDIHDGYESLYSDNEVLTTKKIKCEISTPPITKFCVSCNKLENSSCSSLPDLEIEMEMPSNPAVVERLSSLSPLFEDNLPVSVSTSPTITVAAGGKYKDDSPCSCILSSEAKEINVEHSHEAIRSWVATGQLSDSAEAFKSNAEAVLSGYAGIIRAYLEALKGPVHPSLTNLYEILIKHDHDLDNYLNKE